jgi:hypothetical protein
VASASATPLSQGGVLGSATRKTSNRLAVALRLATFGLEWAKCRLGEFCRRMKGRLGKAERITATAHQLARVIHAMIASGRGYDEAEAFRKMRAAAQTPDDSGGLKTGCFGLMKKEEMPILEHCHPIDVANRSGDPWN